MLKILSLAAFLLTAPLFCEEEVPLDFIPVSLEESDVNPQEIDFMKELKRISYSLGAIIILTTCTIYVLRRFSKKRGARLHAHSKIQVMEQRALSPKTTAYLLHIDGKPIFLAESPHGLTSMYLSKERESKDFSHLLDETSEV